MSERVALVCPRCRHDVLDDHDLPNFVRFYSGDCGWAECEHCGQLLRWTMTVVRQLGAPTITKEEQ